MGDIIYGRDGPKGVVYYRLETYRPTFLIGLGIRIYISFPPPLLIIVGTSESSITKYIRLIYKPPFGFYISISFCKKSSHL